MLLLWGALALVVIVIAVLTRPSSASGKGERFATTGAAFAPVRTFTPDSLHEAIVTGPFPANLLPSGFSFDAQKSPGGKPFPSRGFATPEQEKQNGLEGAAVLALSAATPDQTYLISFLSFSDPNFANAYMQMARNSAGVQSAPGQPVCRAVNNLTVAGCSINVDNVVVEGRAKSASDQPIADLGAAARTTDALMQAGVAYVKQLKGG